MSARDGARCASGPPPRGRRPGLTALLLGLLLAGGCTPEPDPEATRETGAAPAPPVDTQATAAAADTTGTRAALPGLFGIMLGLQTDMAQVSRGVWLEDHAMVAAGARAVADHPTVPPAELQRIQGILGPDLERFRSHDMRVHDLAVRLDSAARSGDMAAVLEADASLRAACVACHTEFRQRLRDGLD